MSKINKQDWALHEQAEALLAQADMSLDEREFVVEHWSPLARHNVGAAGIFFTPPELALDVSAEIGDAPAIIDLCAGTGRLLWPIVHSRPYKEWQRIVALEINPEFVAVGRRVLPEVEWIEGDVFDLEVLRRLGTFDIGVSNPPFGKVKTLVKEQANWLTYHQTADLAVVEVMARLCKQGGIVILPQQAVPFTYEGWHHKDNEHAPYWKAFHAIWPAITLNACNIAVADVHADKWEGTTPKVEVVNLDADETGTFELPIGLPPTRQPKAKKPKATQAPLFGDSA